MKKWLASVFVAVPLLLVGCNSEDDTAIDTNDGDVDVSSLEVKVDILTPEKVAVNEKVQLQAKVTQSDKAVDDADSVEFEIWESGYRDKGKMLEGTLDKDGVYQADFTFDHDGVYYMFAHTTARGMHVMPKKKIVVGNPDMSKVVEDNSSDSMDDMDMDMEEHSHN